MEWHSIKTPLSQFAKVGEVVIVSVHVRIHEQDDKNLMPYSETHEVFLCDVVEFDNVICLRVTNDLIFVSRNEFVAFNTQQQKVILKNNKNAFVYHLVSEPKYAMLLFAKWANINSISLGDLIEEEESK